MNFNSTINAPDTQALQRTSYIKDYFARPAVMVLAVTSLLQVVVTIIFNIISSASVLTAMQNLSSILGNSTMSSSTFSASGSTTITSMIPSVGVSVLVIVAYFLIYFKSKNTNQLVKPTSGFMILYVMSIIELVFVCLITVISIIAIIAVAFSASSSASKKSTYSSSASSAASSGLSVAVVWIMGIAVVIVMALTIYAVVSNMRFYKSVL